MQIDLLYPVAGRRLNERDLSEALTFAFATGGGAATFDQILERAEFQHSCFDAECFEEDLFLDTLIQRCLKPKLGGRPIELRKGYVKSALKRGTADDDVLLYRQGILRELSEDSSKRKECEAIHQRLYQFEQQLVMAETSKKQNPIARRMEILRALKSAVDLVAESFETAASALKTLREFGQRVRKSAAFANLKELIDYDGHLATVDLSVRVGRDGSVRGFSILKARENRRNALYQSPFARFWRRLFTWFRGYRIYKRELQGRLVQAAFDALTDVVTALFQLRADLDFYLAGLALKDFAARRGLAMCLPTFLEGERGSMHQLFNPFLLLEERAPVPADVVTLKGSITIITGPNSGGKTRLLQALGVCQLFGQAGFFVPAKLAELRKMRGLFVSLVHPTTADAREGRLGTELLRIRRLFDKVGVDSLILLDELCSGTNPSEGEEIFRLVVELLTKLEPTAFVSTHFLTFAAGLQKEKDLGALEFIQVELDEGLEPTYGFVPGVAETSLAYKTAERLGVTRKALLDVIARKSG